MSCSIFTQLENIPTSCRNHSSSLQCITLRIATAIHFQRIQRDLSDLVRGIFSKYYACLYPTVEHRRMFTHKGLMHFVYILFRQETAPMVLLYLLNHTNVVRMPIAEYLSI